MTASLWDGQTRYFPVQRISTNHNLYHILARLARGKRKVVDFFRVKSFRDDVGIVPYEKSEGLFVGADAHIRPWKMF